MTFIRMKRIIMEEEEEKDDKQRVLTHHVLTNSEHDFY